MAIAPDQKSDTRDPELPKGYDPVAEAKKLPPIASSPLDTKPYTPDLTTVLDIPPPRPRRIVRKGSAKPAPGTAAVAVMC